MRYTILLILLTFFTFFNRLIADNEPVQLKITTWNVNWLSCTENGKGASDSQQQIKNVATVINAMQSDIVALQEVGTSFSFATIDTLVRLLGSNWAGDIVPSSNSNCGQNQGVLFKKEKISLASSMLLSTGKASLGNTYRYNWSSGRFPAIYNLNIKYGEEDIPFIVVNIHAKATTSSSSDPKDDYIRRKGGADALKTTLDGSSYNSKNVVIIGDFNDYLEGTQCKTCSGSPFYNESPYKNFMDDTENYLGLTTTLYDPSYKSPVIDNIIISNELIPMYIKNSSFRETTATSTVYNFKYTTSDHTPISALFELKKTIGGDSINKTSSQLAVYPNPGKDFFKLEYSSEMEYERLEIYSLQGILIHTEQVQSVNPTIDLKHLEAGTYILKLSNRVTRLIKR